MSSLLNWLNPSAMLYKDIISTGVKLQCALSKIVGILFPLHAWEGGGGGGGGGVGAGFPNRSCYISYYLVA